MRTAIPALILCAAVAAPAFAKLPEPTPEAKAKAAEAAAKTAWTDKVGAYQLCQSMSRTAEHYRKVEKAAGREPPAAVETPACAEPGPFVYTAPVATPPLEAAGAHSPATMATSPPNSKATAAEMQGQPKK
ncbi:MAG: hypothetical protein H7Y61_04785 [Rhizobiales bacterium]|nr:hypothetical protein [Rhizobacter sp.]